MNYNGNTFLTIMNTEINWIQQGLSSINEQEGNGQNTYLNKN